jgi:hypothetical protein
MNISTDATHIFGGHKIQILQPIKTFIAIKPNIATKYVVLQK